MCSHHSRDKPGCDLGPAWAPCGCGFHCVICEEYQNQYGYVLEELDQITVLTLAKTLEGATGWNNTVTTPVSSADAITTRSTTATAATR